MGTSTNFKIEGYKDIKNYIHNYLGLTKDEVKRIMEDVTDVIKSIPMISEPEMSETNWAEKKEYVINYKD